MAIDNFEQIKELLNFSEPNTFYFIQILKRRKENPDMRTGVRVINNYYLDSTDDLERLRERILEDCKKHNARAYINLNRLDYEKVALHTMKQVAEYIIQKDYKAVKNAFSTTCGSHHSEKEKRWIIDIDEEFIEQKEMIRKVVEELHTEIKDNSYKILAEITTKSGFHIITNPFNIDKFKKDKRLHFVGDNLIHKNSPTLLYVD
jgi:ribulose bisphosphate carboxylase small subunit